MAQLSLKDALLKFQKDVVAKLHDTKEEADKKMNQSIASATEEIKTDVHVIKTDVNGIQTNVVELTDRVANLEKDESNLTEIDSNADIFTIHDNLWNDILSEVTEKTSE
jgi:uncharacterized protein involved in exopolysaccharide biosynthesis